MFVPIAAAIWLHLIGSFLPQNQTTCFNGKKFNFYRRMAFYFSRYMMFVVKTGNIKAIIKFLIRRLLKKQKNLFLSIGSKRVQTIFNKALRTVLSYPRFSEHLKIWLFNIKGLINEIYFYFLCTLYFLLYKRQCHGSGSPASRY